MLRRMSKQCYGGNTAVFVNSCAKRMIKGSGLFIKITLVRLDVS